MDGCSPKYKPGSSSASAKVAHELVATMSSATRLFWHKENHTDYLSNQTIRGLSFTARGVWATATALLYWTMDRPGYFIRNGVTLTRADICELIVDQVSRIGGEGKRRRTPRGADAALGELITGGLIVQIDGGIWCDPLIIEAEQQRERNRLGGLARGEQLRKSESEIAERVAEPRAERGSETRSRAIVHQITASDDEPARSIAWMKDRVKNRTDGFQHPPRERRARLVCTDLKLRENYVYKVLQEIETNPDRLTDALATLLIDNGSQLERRTEYERFVAFQEAMRQPLSSAI